MRALMLRRALALAGLVVTWCVCEGAAASRHVHAEPPPIYRTWYTAIVRCASDATDGIDSAARPFDAVTWERMRDSGRVLGRFAPPDTIYLTDRAVGVEWVVSHELLHYLTLQAADGPVFAVCGVRDQETWDARRLRAPPPVPAILRGSGRPAVGR